MPPPTETKAIVIAQPGLAEIQTIPRPALRDDYILVRTTAVALNPTDWKHVKGIDGNTGCIVGCDYAGVVVEVGTKVTKRFAPGDRICGFAHGGNSVQPEDGAFSEYIVVKGDIQIKVPDDLTDEQAATLGVGIVTVRGLYQLLDLPLPIPNSQATTTATTQDQQQQQQPQKPLLLIYGGSTATGILSIQLASLSGYTVIATSSPSNFSYLRSLGAALVIDYKSPTAIQDTKDWILAAHGGTNTLLTKVWDCIGGDSVNYCASVLAAQPGVESQYASIQGVDEAVIRGINPSVRGVKYVLGYDSVGEPFGGKVPGGYVSRGVPGDFEYTKMFSEVVKELLAGGKLKTVREEVNRGGKGGLEGVLFGLKEMEEGRVSATKLVYTL